MKNKLIIIIVLGILLTGIAVAGLTSISITPRDKSLVTKLPTEVKNRLDNDFRKISWDEDVEFTDGTKYARGKLLWEEWNGTDWNSQQKEIQLLADMDFNTKNITVEDYLDIRMLELSDRYFYKRYNKLPDVEDKQEVDVGKKTIVDKK